MAKGTWTIEKLVGAVWTADGTIPRPNEILPITKTSSQQRIFLADGSDAFFAPETRLVEQPITILWKQEDLTLKSKIETYITDHEYLRITTHEATIIFIGRFISFTSNWQIGYADGDETFDMEALFEVME